MATAQKIIADIDAHMQARGGTNSDWYVGIAADPRERLFVAHCVDEKNDVWIFRQADSHTIARAVEKAYHAVGCKGSHGGGDDTTTFVYAYRITPSTSE
jgi:hypothetical protein